MEFATGDVLDGDQLIAHLNARQNNPYIQTWQARAADGKEIVLKLCRYPAYAYKSAVDFNSRVEPHFILPAVPGIAPFLDSKMVEWKDSLVLKTRRQYYSTRLIDLFPADADHPPSRSLLNSFALLADILDTLEKEVPRLSFDLSPGDLLMDGDRLVITDLGMSRLMLSLEPDYRLVPAGILARREPEGGVPLVAAYPSLELGWRGVRTHAQYAVAALYLYFRSRFLVFEDGSEPFPEEQRGLPLMMWMSKLFDRIKLYDKSGQIALWMLADEHERALVSRALANNPAERYASGAAFVAALRDLQV
jgi:hypothetical protein